MWTEETSCGNETAKIKDSIAFYLQGKGLDLGCAIWKVSKSEGLENNCIGVDMVPDADVCANVADLSMFSNEAFDYVYSSHTLEDFSPTMCPIVLREWWSKVKVGGHLILYLPLTRSIAKDMGLENWEGFYPNIGEAGGNIAHRHDFDPRELKKTCAELFHAELVVDEIRGDKDEYSFLLIYKKLSSIKLPVVGTVLPEKLKRALVVRYGAAGDMVQSTPVYRLLKEQGYHVTAAVSGYGEEVLKNNPHIDEIVRQRRNQVPNQNLETFWADIGNRYDRFVNLTGSVEDNLLLPDRALYAAMEELRKKAPDASELDLMKLVLEQFRKRVGNKNYFDSHLEMGGFSERGLNGEIYLSPSEQAGGNYFRYKYRNNFVIMWVLAGSAYHKWYPYFDQVVNGIFIKIPEAVVVSVGEDACMLMERPESNRYLPRSGKWKWRQTLIMTKFVDLVVGPETGVLNAAGCFDTPKITMLSHSTHDNLCKYWKNDYCLAPPEDKGIFCYPCHVLHFVHPYGKSCEQCGIVHMKDESVRKEDDGFWSCPYDELYDADNAPFPICMARQHPDRVIARIMEVYDRWKSLRASKELVQIA